MLCMLGDSCKYQLMKHRNFEAIHASMLYRKVIPAATYDESFGVSLSAAVREKEQHVRVKERRREIFYNPRQTSTPVKANSP